MSTIAQDAAATGADSRADPTDERPLTDEERKLVSRLLSDPFTFPQVYKTWLVAFLEGSDMTLPLSSVLGLTNLLGSAGGGSPGIFKLLPAGMIFAWGGTAVPNGTYECDGQALNRVSYDRLFKVIGTRWGAGDGSTTFNVPDLRGRAPYGRSSQMGLGATDGLPEGSRHASHHHSFGIESDIYSSGGGSTDGAGGHDHGYSVVDRFSEKVYNSADGARNIMGGTSGATTSYVGDHGHSFGVGVWGHLSAGGPTSGAAPTDAPSYAGVVYIINA